MERGWSCGCGRKELRSPHQPGHFCAETVFEFSLRSDLVGVSLQVLTCCDVVQFTRRAVMPAESTGGLSSTSPSPSGFVPSALLMPGAGDIALSRGESSLPLGTGVLLGDCFL